MNRRFTPRFATRDGGSRLALAEVTMKSMVGLVLGVAIGAACRWFEIPVPAPPRLIGALLVVAMTIGYLLADRALGVLDGRANAIPSSRPAVDD